jgi:hypothetical protein
LDPPRIKAIASDLSRDIRLYGKFLNEKRNNSLVAMRQEEEASARQQCLKSISAIIPHHCGDHSQCDHGTCTFKRIEFQERSANEVSGNKLSEAELAKRVSERSCHESRFKGKYMSMDQEGKEMCIQAIQSRVNKNNIDQLAKILSSNICECYFSVLVKFSHGKRLNLGQSDSWEVLLNFVGGLMSHTTIDISTRIMGSFKIKENEIQIVKRKKMKRKKNSDKARKETEKYKRKRIASDFARKQRAAKDSTKKERHMPDKISLVKGRGKQKSTPRCANCHGPHITGTCVDAMYEKPLPSPSKKQKMNNAMSVNEILRLF